MQDALKSINHPPHCTNLVQCCITYPLHANTTGRIALHKAKKKKKSFSFFSFVKYCG
jgi:hypothetical protein